MNKAPLDSVKMDQHWKTLLDALDQGILVTAEDWSIDFVNRAACALLGCRDEREFYERWGTVLREQAVDAFGRGEDACAGAFIDFDVPEGERSRRLRLECYLLDEEHHVRALLLRDREQRTEVPPGDLRLIGRYRSLARLYRTMGHDLKAPLNALTINMDLLKTSLTRYAPADPMIRERQQRYMKVLDDELGRLNRSLVNFLAQAVPPTQDAARPFSLREVLMELVSLLAPQARQQQVAVEVLMDEQNLMLEGQRDLLKQALLNIAVNALEAMSGGGRLTIKLETRMGRAIILIQDTGSGIAAESMEKIWELNYTTKKTGSGIGLYVARSVIESFGGSIGVDSRGGQGTCFTVTLPITLKEGL